MRLPVSLLVSEASWLAMMTDAPWTYIVLGASTIITEELAPIFGGIAVHERELRLIPLIAAITLGGWIATSLLYAVGRLKWETIRRRFPRTRATGTVALRVVRRNPLTASFFVRFAFGLRIVLPMASGAARVPLYVFLPVSLIGSLAWTLVFTLVGYVAGEAAVQAIGHLGKAGEIVGAVVVPIAVFAFLRWQRRRRERKAERRAMARRSPDAKAWESDA
jgi:membrane protein DedA with SNARE-associated domain